MDGKNKTVLFVMPRLPFPASSGRKTSLYHYCRILSEELGYRLIVAAFLESGDDPRLKPQFIDKLVVLPKASVKEKITNIVKFSIILKRLPLQVSLYLSRKAQLQIDAIVEEEKPDIVIGDMVRSTEYIKNIRAYRIADLDDRISLRYQRQLETDIEGINPYGAFINTMPKVLQRFMLLKPVKLSVVKNEISLLREYELKIGEICDSTVFVAKQEADNFNQELGKNKAVAIPIGVDTEYFSRCQTENNENYIGFLGAMSVAHNENAARHFIIDILPMIINKIPGAKFMVIGGGASDELKKLQSEHVIFTGRVDDVRDYLEKCKVFVCPMTFGSGIKTKNLEAMAMGLPIVTTSIGAENINAIDGKEWLIADDNAEFAKQTCMLLCNDDAAKTIARNGSEFISNNFTWEAAKNAWERLLNNG